MHGSAEEQQRDAFLRSVRGSFELHVFVAPLDPPAEHCERFAAACAAGQMKGLHLFLVYDRGPVGVLQSSAYVDGGFDDAVARCHAQAQHLRDSGFEVIREKIEALADDSGVPRTTLEARRAPDDLYFEFHVSVGGPDDRALDDGDREFLEQLAGELSRRFTTRVPLSWNAFKPAQRFLNARTYQLGCDASMEIVDLIVQRIAEGGLVVKKTIREFIVYDTNKDVDRGWVEDPLPRAPRGARRNEETRMSKEQPSAELTKRLVDKYESSVDAMLPIREQILARVLQGIDKGAALLDVGHGIGENLRIMQAWGYENAAGIDNDPAMQPPALGRGCRNLVLADVLTLEPSARTYALVFAQAFLQIYPKSEARAVLAHLLALASDRVYLSMKVHATASEALEEKLPGVERFRARYTWDEIETLAREVATPAGWRLTSFPLTDPLGRAWINIVFDR